MHSFRSFFSFALLLGAAYMLLQQDLRADEHPLKFRWAVLYDDQAREPVNISRERKHPLNSTSRLRFYIKAETDLTVYLFYVAPDETLSTVLAESMKASKEHLLIPDEKNWYQFSDTQGTEKFIVIVSPKRIPSIDELLSALSDNPAKLSTRLHDELKHQRQLHSSMASEKIRAIETAGVVRGDASNREQAELIETDDFYIKTYRFEHR